MAASSSESLQAATFADAEMSGCPKAHSPAMEIDIAIKETGYKEKHKAREYSKKWRMVPYGLARATAGLAVMRSKHADTTENVWKCVSAVSLGRDLAATTLLEVGRAQCAGMVRLRKTMADFYLGKPQWQSYQMDAFNMILCCSAKYLLAEDTALSLEAAMAEFGWSKIHNEALIMAYRGSGKSSVIAASFAAIIRNCPNLTATLYAGTQTKANDLLQTLIDLFLVMERQRPTGYRNSRAQSNFSVNTGLVGDIRWVRAFSTFGQVRPSVFPFSFLRRARAHTSCSS